MQEICDTAMVNRATFYNHFNDKQDLVNFCLKQIEQDIFKRAIDNKNFNSSKDIFMTLASHIIDFLKDNEDTINLIVNNNSIERVRTILNDTISKIIQYLIIKNEFNEEYIIPEKIIVDYVVGGLTNIGISCFTSRENIDKDTFLHYLDILLNANTFLTKEKK